MGWFNHQLVKSMVEFWGISRNSQNHAWIVFRLMSFIKTTGNLKSACAVFFCSPIFFFGGGEGVATKTHPENPSPQKFFWLQRESCNRGSQPEGWHKCPVKAVFLEAIYRRDYCTLFYWWKKNPLKLAIFFEAMQKGIYTLLETEIFVPENHSLVGRWSCFCGILHIFMGCLCC